MSVCHVHSQKIKMHTHSTVLHLSLILCKISLTCPHHYWACQPQSLSSIKPVNHKICQPPNLLSTKPINHKSFFAQHWPCFELSNYCNVKSSHKDAKPSGMLKEKARHRKRGKRMLHYRGLEPRTKASSWWKASMLTTTPIVPWRVALRGRI